MLITEPHGCTQAPSPFLKNCSLRCKVTLAAVCSAFRKIHVPPLSETLQYVAALVWLFDLFPVVSKPTGGVYANIY